MGGGKQLSATSQDPHFSPVRNQRLSHPLWATGAAEHSSSMRKELLAKQKKVIKVLLQYACGPYIKRRSGYRHAEGDTWTQGRAESTC